MNQTRYYFEELIILYTPYRLTGHFSDYDHVGFSYFGKMETKYRMRLMRPKGLCRYLFIFFLYFHLQFKTQRSYL